MLSAVGALENERSLACISGSSANDADDHGTSLHRDAGDLAMDCSAAAAVAGAFPSVDAALPRRQLAKIADGGRTCRCCSLLAVYGAMLVWHIGAQAVSARLQETVVPIILRHLHGARIAEGGIPRVLGRPGLPDGARRSAGDGLAFEAQPRAARTCLHPHGPHRGGTVDRRRQSGCRVGLRCAGSGGSMYTRKAQLLMEAPKRGHDDQPDASGCEDRPGALGWRRGS